MATNASFSHTPPLLMRPFATLIGLLMLGSFATQSNAQAYESTDTPLAVADGTPGGAVCGDPGDATVSTINVPDAGTISDLNIFIDIASTWVGDVTATLTRGATTIVLIDRPGAATEAACGDGSDNYPGIFLDDEGGSGDIESSFPFVSRQSYTPAEALSVFDGQSISGDWTLTVTDGGEGDATSINEWQLLFNGAFPVAFEAAPLTQGYAFDLVGANPFATTTRFNLQVAETQPVRVAAYDVRGREVAEFHDGLVTAGTPLAVTFARGELPAGVYMVRAEGAAFATTQRVIVVR